MLNAQQLLKRFPQLRSVKYINYLKRTHVLPYSQRKKRAPITFDEDKVAAVIASWDYSPDAPPPAAEYIPQKNNLL